MRGAAARGRGRHQLDRHRAALRQRRLGRDDRPPSRGARSPRPHVSTKVRIEPTTSNDIPGAIERSLEQSLQAAALDRVALFQLHNQLGAGGRRPADADAGAGAGHRRRRRHVRPAQGAGAVPRQRHHGRRRHRRLPRSDRQRPLRLRAGLLQRDQSERRLVARAPAWKAQDFSGIIAACFRQNMGVLNIRVWAGGPLASARAPGAPRRADLRHRPRQRDALRRRGACGARRRLRHAGADGAALRARQPRPRPTARRSASPTSR